MEKKDDLMAALALLKKDVDRAQHTAEMAASSINAHIDVCALRYDTISAKLDMIPSVFSKIEIMSSRLNIATGVWIGILGIGGFAGVIYTVMRIGNGG